MLLSGMRQPNSELNKLRCSSCPFSTLDKDVLEAHKRRHGIERVNLFCPHCDYVPKKEESEAHLKLHFTRLYKPDSYFIVDSLSLSMRRGGKEGKEEVLFRDCGNGSFVPETRNLALPGGSEGGKEKVIVDPKTGEAKRKMVS